MAKFDEAVSKGDVKMTEKVKVSREVADAIEQLRKIPVSSFGIISRLGRRMGLGETGLQRDIDTISKWAKKISDGYETIIKALVNGYEVEATPEERLREYYEELRNKAINGDYFETNSAHKKRDGLLKTLEILGIEIAGINAKGDA